MAALTASAVERLHVLGDIQARIFTLGNVANADTFALPDATGVRILGAFTINAAGNAVTWSLSGSTFTAVSGGAATAVKICVLVG